MNPRIVIIAGPHQGALFELTDEELLIGRDPSSWLRMADPSASRRHCLIIKESDHFKITDLDSRNGTFVNQIPVREKILQHGDFIEVGNSIFLFLSQEEPVAAASQAVLSKDNAVPLPTSELNFANAIYLQPEMLHAAFPLTARIAQGLKALLEMSSAINSIRNPEKLQQKLLESLIEVVPAQRAAILLRMKGPEELAITWSLDKCPTHGSPFQINHGIVTRVLEDGVGIISSDVENLKAPSLLLVPLIVFEKVIGVIYLETKDPHVRFDEDHLQFMTAAAAMAAVALENAQHVAWLENENLRLRDEANIESNLIGESSAMREVHQFIAKVSATDSTVLIHGESGTGKELAARAIHRNSSRSEKPFVAIDCAALAEPLLESELFGHEKGAFTGAINQKKGKLEVADGGTVFLDEVAELSPVLQSKLLRVLQEREFERVGGIRPVKVDVRFIAATNRNLEEAIRTDAFRQDLFYRLNVVSLVMPPLRTHPEDIPLLSTFFAAKYSKKTKRKIVGISAEARTLLINYGWPGNVRELENAIERALVLGAAELILPEDLPEVVLEAQHNQESPTKYCDAVTKAKKQIVLKALEQASGDYSEAAKQLGVHPNNLYRLIRNLNLRSG